MPSGEQTLLYTTALDENERIHVLDIEEETIGSIQLPKAVAAVEISPSGETDRSSKARGRPRRAGIDPDELIDRSYGYSMLQLDTGFSKLQLTAADLGPSLVFPTEAMSYSVQRPR